MKTQEEIEQLANEYANVKSSSDVFKDAHKNDFIKGYTQSQKDMTLQGKCLSGKSYNDCHIHSSNLFGCLSCGNFERKQD